MNPKKKSIKVSSRKLMVNLPKKEEKVRLAIECTKEERKFIRMYASYEDKTLNQFVMDCVKMKIAKCKYSHTPNEKTKATLDASEKGEGIVMFDSIDDFFKSMEE